MTATRPFLVLLLSVAPALAAPGEVAWRVDLQGPALSHPAVSASGRIALATAKGVLVLDPEGEVLQRIEDTVSGQPMWDGEKLWVRTAQGWRRHAGEEVSEPCPADTALPTLDRAGHLVWASERALETCAPERRLLVARKGRAGQVLFLREGLATADEWWLELFDAELKPTVILRVDEVGTPAGVDRDGRLVVTAPNGRLRTLDAKGRIVWEGPLGDDGPPLATKRGLVVLGGRSVSLVDGTDTRWSVPVAAGVRQAAVLEGGVVAILERSGRLGLIEDGRPVWARRLLDPGQLFGVHPTGLLLVQEGDLLVAWRSPPPDTAASIPVFRGLDRSGRPPR